MGVCELHETITDKVKQLDQEKIAIVQGIHEMRERLSKVEEQIKVANNRIADQEEETKSLTRIATSIEVMSKDLTHLVDTLRTHDGRIGAMEKKPGEHWQTLLYIIMGAAVGYIGSLL